MCGEAVLTVRPPIDVAEQAKSEGWIHLPAAGFDLTNLLDHPVTQGHVP